MDIGVGLPTAVAVRHGRGLINWARQADRLGFSTIGVTDRLVYDNYEPLVTLGAMASATTRIRLATTILIAPYRGNVPLLTKQLASLDCLSGGRLVAGIAAGGREDDFEISGMPYGGRGRWLDAALGEMLRLWREAGDLGGLGPRPMQQPLPLLLGGHSERAMRRAARFGSGWIAGASSALSFAELAERVRTAWSEQRRTGEPRLAALAYACLGPRGRRDAERYLLDYYSFLGARAARIASSAITDAGLLAETLCRYEEAGCHELILLPCSAEPSQLGLLAEATAVGLRGAGSQAPA